MGTNGIFNYIPTAQYLFKRAYSIAFGPPNQVTANQYGTIVPVGVTPSPLKIRFEIDKNMYGSSPNHSKIEIFNLASATRQSIKQGFLVNLQGGYNNLIGTIFTGSVYIAKNDRNGADIITSLECMDGVSAITQARWDQSYPAGATLVQVLTDVAKAMSVTSNFQPLGVNAGVAVGIPNVVYNKGITAQGPCKDTLDKLLKPQGLEWSVQDGNLNIIPQKNFDGNTAQVVSSKTGMIGVPSAMDGFVQFTALLNPKLSPGSLVQLISENTVINGFYKIRRTKYEGDTHDNKWQVTCEGLPAPEVSQSLPAAQGFNYNPSVVA